MQSVSFFAIVDCVATNGGDNMISLEMLKSIGEFLQKAGKIEEFNAIITLQDRVRELTQENDELKKEISTLKDISNIERELEYRDDAYWRKTGEGPFCVPCWDGKKQLMRMTGKDVIKCHTCGYKFWTEEYRQKIITDTNKISSLNTRRRDRSAW